MTNDEKEPQENGDPPAQDAPKEEQGPDTADLDKDPAYNPDDPNLKGIKGG